MTRNINNPHYLQKLLKVVNFNTLFVPFVLRVSDRFKNIMYFSYIASSRNYSRNKIFRSPRVFRTPILSSRPTRRNLMASYRETEQSTRRGHCDLSTCLGILRPTIDAHQRDNVQVISKGTFSNNQAEHPPDIFCTRVQLKEDITYGPIQLLFRISTQTLTLN